MENRLVTLVFLSIYIGSCEQTCANLNMGTHRHIPNIVSNGKVSVLYDPGSDAFVYTPYDQTSEYIYIRYNGPEINVGFCPNWEDRLWIFLIV